MILGVTGPLAAGKGETTEYLHSKGFVCYSLSDIIREECRSRGLDTSRSTMLTVGNELRAREGAAVLAMRTLARIRKESVKDVAIDSVRNPHEVEALKAAGAVIVGIDADVRLRFKRLKERNRQGDVKSFEELLEVERKENSSKDTDQQLLACYRMADHFLTNNDSREGLYLQIDRILERIGWKP